MNAKIPALALIVALPLCATAAQPEPAGITMDCARPALPSQQQVARLAGLDNFGQVYAARERLMRQGLRACERGARQVVIVWIPAPGKPSSPAVASIEGTR